MEQKPRNKHNTHTHTHKIREQIIKKHNMEKPKSTFPKQEKNKAVISMGNASGGGGIGVGIIFLGGAVASATAAFLIRRRLRKSSSTSNSKNCNHDRSIPSSEIPYKFQEDRNKNQSKGLQFVARASSPYADTDQNLRFAIKIKFLLIFLLNHFINLKPFYGRYLY